MSPISANIHADDYYQVLGVDKTASEADIAKAYKKLALKHHPDKNPDNKEQAEEDFKKISEAYDVLRDPQRRKDYDQFGKAGPQTGGFSGDGGSEGHAGRGMSREEADAIFKMFFGGSDPSSMFAGGNGMSGMPGGVFMSRSSMPGGACFVFSDAGPHEGSVGGSGMPADFDLGGLGGLGGMFSRPGMGMRSRASGRSGAGCRSRSGPCRRSAASAPHVLPSGTTVVARGLTKVPEHNGKTGTVLSWEEARGRYQVELDGNRLSLRPQNLTQLCHVELIGLANKPELNSQVGEVLNYDESKGRYMVLIRSTGAAVALQPGNCVLNAGTRVIVQGLAAQQFNGQMAQVVGVDRDALRYTVQCQNGAQIKIKFDNVLC